MSYQTDKARLPLPVTTGNEWPMNPPMNTAIPELPPGQSWPRISIVTPSFNQSAYLEKTIRSVLLQGYPKLEYLVIDGGSSDHSVEVIKRYEPWIDYWVSEKDHGQSHAINKGLGKVTGELLGWLNSDDYYLPGALFKFALAYLEDTSVGVIYGQGHVVNEKGEIVHTPKLTPVTTDSLYGWCFGNDFMQPSSLFTRAAWLKSGLLNEDLNFCLDVEYWIRINANFRFRQIPDVLSIALSHPQAKTTVLRYRALAEFALVCMKRGREDWAKQTLDLIIKELEEGNKELKMAVGLLHNRLDAMIDSASWRITAPLRNGKKWIRNLIK